MASVVPVAALEAIPSLLHDSGALRRGLELMLDPLPKPIRALSLRVYPDRVLLQVQDRNQPLAVQQYRFKGGAVEGPMQVKLTGPGALEDNLFLLQRADLNVIPRLAAPAERRAALTRGRATSITLQRNMPASMDVRFSIEVKGVDGKRLVEARKDGKILSVQSER
jgi:hypothetical protein